MGLKFRKTAYIPDFVYKTSVLPKTIEQCDYLIAQKLMECKSVKERYSTLKLQHDLIKNEHTSEEGLELIGRIRTIRNALATVRNQLTLLYQWREDFIKIDDNLNRKDRNKYFNKLRGEVKELKSKIYEMEAKLQSVTPLKRLASQVEQIARHLAQLIFIPSKLVSPLQIVELQRISREISGKPPDPNFVELMQPFVDKAKADRDKRKEEAAKPVSTVAANDKPSDQDEDHC